jgi:hypothetical protein
VITSSVQLSGYALQFLQNIKEESAEYMTNGDNKTTVETLRDS